VKISGTVFPLNNKLVCCFLDERFLDFKATPSGRGIRTIPITSPFSSGKAFPSPSESAWFFDCAGANVGLFLSPPVDVVAHTGFFSHGKYSPQHRDAFFFLQGETIQSLFKRLKGPLRGFPQISGPGPNRAYPDPVGGGPTGLFLKRGRLFFSVDALFYSSSGLKWFCIFVPRWTGRDSFWGRPHRL